MEQISTLLLQNDKQADIYVLILITPNKTFLVLFQFNFYYPCACLFSLHINMTRIMKTYRKCIAKDFNNYLVVVFALNIIV